jgi:hypothetical protein
MQGHARSFFPFCSPQPHRHVAKSPVFGMGLDMHAVARARCLPGQPPVWDLYKQARPTSQHGCLTPPPTSNSPIPDTPAWHLLRAQGSGLRGPGSGAYVIKNSPDMHRGPWPQMQSKPPSVYMSVCPGRFIFLPLLGLSSPLVSRFSFFSVFRVLVAFRLRLRP